jgi:hypothetical protein
VSGSHLSFFFYFYFFFYPRPAHAPLPTSPCARAADRSKARGGHAELSHALPRGCWEESPTRASAAARQSSRARSPTTGWWPPPPCSPRFLVLGTSGCIDPSSMPYPSDRRRRSDSRLPSPRLAAPRSRATQQTAPGPFRLQFTGLHSCGLNKWLMTSLPPPSHSSSPSSQDAPLRRRCCRNRCRPRHASTPSSRRRSKGVRVVYMLLAAVVLVFGPRAPVLVREADQESCLHQTDCTC